MGLVVLRVWSWLAACFVLPHEVHAVFDGASACCARRDLLLALRRLRHADRCRSQSESAARTIKAAV